MSVRPTRPGTELGEAPRVRYRVRFDEAGPDGLARSSALLRYAQECAWIHSEAVGMGREWYAERGLTWVVRCLELAVVGSAATGTTVEVSTRVVGFRRVWGSRSTEIRGADGAVVAVVSSDWVMVDLRRGLPARVPDEFSRAFAVQQAPFQPHRVALPPTPEAALSIAFAVRHHELDPLDHANHAVYLDWLEEAVLALPEQAALLARVPRTYRLEYEAPATVGLGIVGRAWVIDEPGQPAGVAYRLEGDGRDLIRGVLTPGSGGAGPHRPAAQPDTDPR